MVQVIVQRQNQKATVDCSKVKGYVLGNGPSRTYLNLEELQKDGIIYGCNALYRDFSPDYLFASDFGMIRQIFADDYKGNCIFTDMDITPIIFFNDIFESLRMSLPPNVAVNIKYTGNKETATDFLYLGKNNVHHVLWISQTENTNFEWGFRPLDELPSTGMMALQKAAENGHEEIIMYGFDGLKYDGTMFYENDSKSIDKKRHPEVDKWNQYYEKIVEKFPHTKIQII